MNGWQAPSHDTARRRTTPHGAEADGCPGGAWTCVGGHP